MSKASKLLFNKDFTFEMPDIENSYVTGKSETKDNNP